MKTINYLMIAMLAITAASCSGKAESESAEADQAITIDSLLTVAPKITDKLVKVEGVCTHTCKHGARKIFLEGSDDTKTIRVEACELGAFDPEVVNSLVTVTGYVRETRIDEEYLRAWEERVNEYVAKGYGQPTSGCDTERASRGVESESSIGQIEEYRQRIAQKVADGGDPWLSFYHIDAVDYEF